jgi:hypothetical protein
MALRLPPVGDTFRLPTRSGLRAAGARLLAPGFEAEGRLAEVGAARLVVEGRLALRVPL